MSFISAIVVAAGSGKRFGEKKQFASLKGQPVLEWALRAFETHEEINSIILVLPEEVEESYYLERHEKISGVVRGGEKRQDSVWEGFKALDAEAAEMVLIHDGARPLVSRNLISRVIEGTRTGSAAVPILPFNDTIKEIADGGVIRTVDRSRFFRVQTPQGFLVPVLKEALATAYRDQFYGTDEAMLVERVGVRVATVEGDSRNIKITTPIDIRLAEAMIDG